MCVRGSVYGFRERLTSRGNLLVYRFEPYYGARQPMRSHPGRDERGYDKDQDRDRRCAPCPLEDAPNQGDKDQQSADAQPDHSALLVGERKLPKRNMNSEHGPGDGWNEQKQFPSVVLHRFFAGPVNLMRVGALLSSSLLAALQTSVGIASAQRSLAPPCNIVKTLCGTSLCSPPA